MQNARLHDETVARERLKRDLALAKRMQDNFMPSRWPQVAGYEFFAHYQPAQEEEVGGDCYSFISLPEGRLAVILGHAAGKGVDSALLMTRLLAAAQF
jgi:serine phosphatase RsbU (regulator of sigma subunit)